VLVIIDIKSKSKPPNEHNPVIPLEYYEKQLEFLFNVHELREKKKYLLNKLNKIEVSKVEGRHNRMGPQVNAIKIYSKKINERLNKLEEQLSNSCKIDEIKGKLKDLIGYLSNLSNAYKKGEIDSKAYNVAKVNYIQAFEKEKRKLETLKSFSRINLRDLTYDLLYLEEKKRVSKKAKLRGKISKRELSSIKGEIDEKINRIKKKAMFLEDFIISSKFKTPYK